MGTDAVVEGPFVCVLCKFGYWLDDVMGNPTSRGSCLCLRCYFHGVEDERPFPVWLRREVAAILAGA